ncbi:MAG: ABC transporter ATP-binding protein [Oscillospiraceae bacterium]
MLKADNVTIRFGGLTAVDHVSMDIAANKITGLIGPNGAGKTTFFNSISGVYVPDEGSVIFDGKRIDGKKPYQINAAGISRTYQVINLFWKMDVLDNVLVGMHSKLKSGYLADMFRLPKQRKEEKEAHESAMKWLDFAGLTAYANEPASNLSYGKQRLLEIVRGLASEPKLILLDEPAAGMNSTEKKELDELLKKIIKMGVTILMIEHDMKLMMDVCDYIYVLNDGKLLAHGVPKEIQNNPDVITAYLGGE